MIMHSGSITHMVRSDATTSASRAINVVNASIIEQLYPKHGDCNKRGCLLVTNIVGRSAIEMTTLMQELSRRLADAVTADRMKQIETSLAALQWANEALTYNPNEGLLLQALFVKLGQDTSVVLV